MSDRLTFEGLRQLVEGRGFQIEPYHDAEDRTRVTGARLVGPRRNRKVMIADAGLFSISEAKLWCDSVDYASRRVRERAANRVGRK